MNIVVCLIIVFDYYNIFPDYWDTSAGGLFHCYMLDKSIVILGVSGLFFRFYSFLWIILLANNVDPEQTPHDVASDLVCTVCL